MTKEQHLKDAGCKDVKLDKYNWKFKYKGQKFSCADYILGNIIRNSKDITDSLKQYFDALLNENNN